MLKSDSGLKKCKSKLGFITNKHIINTVPTFDNIKNYLTYNYYFNCLKYSKMKKMLKSDSGLKKCNMGKN
jgi:hypothetical protein